MTNAVIDVKQAQPSSVLAQAAWRFFHDGEDPVASVTPYDFRQFLKAAIRSWPHLKISARQSAKSLTLTGRDRDSSRWMVDHMGELLAEVSNFAGKLLQVDPKTLVPGFRAGPRSAYAVPRLIVQRADKNDKWERWLPDELGQVEKDAIQALIADGVAAELKRWGLIGESFSPGGIIVTDYGHAMPITPAEGPRGIARLGVRFIAPWQIDGEIFVGLHTLQGHGLVYRRGELNVAQAATPAGTRIHEETV